MSFSLLRNVVLVGVFLLAGPVWAGSGITYHGRLMKPDGSPVLSSHVEFKIQIRTPGNENCLMYEETHIKDLSVSDGVFAIGINDGTATPGNTEPFALDRIFQNRGTFNFGPGKCSGATVYTPNIADGRKIAVDFNDGSFVGWESMPTQAINFVPMAIEAMTVGGFGATNLLRVVDGAGVPLPNVLPLTSTQHNSLLDLVNGTSAIYLTSSSPVDGANLANGSVTDATLATGISGSKISGNISGNAAGFTGSLAGDVTGTQGATTVVRLQGRNVDTAPPSDGQVLKWNNGSSRWEPANDLNSGTSFGSQTARQVFAAPTGSSGTPTFRHLGIADLQSNVGGAFFLASGACPTGQNLAYQSPADTISCVAFSLSSSQVTTALGFTPADAADFVAKSGDTMTGVLNLPANGLVAGTNQLVLSGTNVGIGTITPGQKLHVVGTNGTTLKIVDGNQGANKVLTSDANGVASWQAPAAGADNLGNHTATQNIVLGTNWLSGDGNNEGIYVNSSGYVGVGLSSPTDFVDIQGGYANGLKIRGPAVDNNWYGGITLTNSTSAGAAATISASTNGLFFGYGGSERMRISNTGMVGIGTNAPTSTLHSIASGAKTAGFTGNLLANTATSSTASILKTGLDVQSTGSWAGASAVNVGLNVNATGGTTNYAALLNGGNVGIGTTAPTGTLDIYRTQASLLNTSDNVLSVRASSMDNLGAGADPTLLDISGPYGGTPKGRLLRAANSGNTFELINSNVGFARIYSGTFASPVPGTAAGPKPMLGVSFDGTLGDGLTPLLGVGVNMNVAWTGGTPSYQNVYGVPVKIRGSSTASYGLYSDVSGSTKNWAIYAANGESYFKDSVGIGTTTPRSSLDLGAKTDALLLTSGTTAQRPGTPVNGMIRYNSDNAKLESYVNGSWQDIAAAATGGSYLSSTGGTVSGALTVSSGGISNTGGLNNNSGGITNTGTLTGVGANITGAGALTVAAGGSAQNLTLNSTTTGSVNVGSTNGTSLSVLNGGGGTVNYVTVKGAATGAAPVIGTEGADTNIDLKMTPKGTGNVLFTAGNIGISTATPGAKIDINGGQATTSPIINIVTAGNGAGGVGPSYGIKLVTTSHNQNTGSFGVHSYQNANGYNSNQAALYGESSGVSVAGIRATGVWGKSLQIGGTYGVGMGIRGEVDISGMGTIGTSYAGYFDNMAASGGTNYGVYVNSATGGVNTVPLAVAVGGAEKFRVSGTGAVGIGTATPHTSALLDVSSTSKGFLPPRMTTAQRTAVSTPSEGLLVFDTDLDTLMIYNGVAWRKLAESTEVSFEVTKTAGQGLPNNVFTIVTWEAKTFDVGSSFDLATERFQPTVPGKYLVTGMIATSTSVPDGSYLQVGIYKNATNYDSSWITSAAPGQVSVHVTSIVEMNGSTDYLDLRAITNTASQTIRNERSYTRMQAFLISGGTGGSGGAADNMGNHVATQNLSLAGNWLSGDGDAEGIQVDASGNVGIGTATPGSKLHVSYGANTSYAAQVSNAGGNGYGLLVKAGSLGSTGALPLVVTDNANNNLFYIRGDGGYYHSGSNLSTKESKQNIQPMTENALNLLKDIEVVTYKYKMDSADRPERIGFIANDENHVYDDRLTNHKKGFDVPTIVGVMIKAFQEIYAQLTGQEERLENQQREIASLKERAGEAEAKAVKVEKEKAEQAKEMAELKARMDRLEKQLRSK